MTTGMDVITPEVICMVSRKSLQREAETKKQVI
jgi:hypothetical protein